MDYDIIHPKYGEIRTKRELGTILFRALGPETTFSCQLVDVLLDQIVKIVGAIAVVDIAKQEVVAIIDSMDLGSDQEGVHVRISIDELSDACKTHVEYVMYLFKDVKYEFDAVLDQKDVKRNEPSLKDLKEFKCSEDNENLGPQVFAAPLTLGIVTMHEVENVSGKIKYAPRIELNQMLVCYPHAIMTESPSSSLMILLDFESEAGDEITRLCQEAFGESVTRQAAVIIAAITVAVVEGEMEPSKTYNIYPACSLN